jgi:hypothetical protein
MFENKKMVKTKICRHCKENFDITDKDLEFYEKVSPSFWGKKYLIPTPTLCPDCRQQRRLAFRNERSLYKRKCNFSGKDIISIYSPDKPYKIYHQDIWWSDKWDSMIYKKDFDFRKNFFEQFEKLSLEVPRPALSADNNENCEFVNVIGYSKNCFLCYSGDYNENCFYSSYIDKSINCFDCLLIEKCNNCYDLYDGKDCYECFSSSHIKDCSFCFHCSDCINCNFCIGCVWLRNKQYYLYNKSVTKEKFSSFQKQWKTFNSEMYNQILLENPKLYWNFIQCQNSTWDDLFECKNCSECFNLKRADSCKYVERGYDSFDCYDAFGCFSWKLCYELSSVWVPAYKCYFSAFCWREVNNIFYCDHCFNCSNLFWCVWLRHKEYCILNKQYTKEEYEKLVPKIIEHMSSPQLSPTGEGVREWWEFFPASFSPFGYNETIAQEYYPINPPVLADIPLIKGDSQSGAEAGGLNYIDREWNIYKTLQEAGKRPVFKYSIYEAPFPKVEKIIPASKLPENITEIPDDILNWAIECEITKKPFRIIKQELEFYRKHNLPIPKKHPDQRHLDRMKLRNPRKLFERTCDKCKKEIQTTYAPERPEIVYCQECYEKEIY